MEIKKVANLGESEVETLVTTGQVVLAGEIKTQAYVDLQRIAREVINCIGYTKSEYMFEGNSCGVFSAIHEQSGDINRGVEREERENQGAGDQGMMFGYATNETENYMPLSLDLAHNILRVLADIRREGKEMLYLRPDAKSQVTIEYDDNGKPVRIDTIVVSTQHDEFVAPADSSKEAQLKAEGLPFPVVIRQRPYGLPSAVPGCGVPEDRYPHTDRIQCNHWL